LQLICTGDSLLGWIFEAIDECMSHTI